MLFIRRSVLIIGGPVTAGLATIVIISHYDINL